jgi:hypothetical protein
MVRFNIFYSIHNALRAMLYDTAGQLQRTDFSDPVETNTVLNSIETLIGVLDTHAGFEDHFILSVISRLDASVKEAFTTGNVRDFELTTRLRGLLRSYASMVSGNDKIAIGHSINVSFVELMVFNLTQMAKEELVINPILWKHYTDGQLRSIVNELQAQVPRDHFTQVIKWMVHGLNTKEIIQWLKQVENCDSPEPLLCNLLTLVETELPADRRNRIIEGMTEGALMPDC